MSNSALVGAVKSALASAEQYTSRSLLMPDVSTIPDQSIRAYSVTTPKLLKLTAEEFGSGLQELYERIQVGEHRVVVAATGVGKTTAMPRAFASVSNKSGIVVLPNRTLLTLNLQYIKEQSKGTGVFVDALRSKYIDDPPLGVAVYYVAATDFLIRLQRDQGLLKRLCIGFIYLDEAHELIAVYKFMGIARNLPLFDTVKVFYGTASAEGVSMLPTGKFDNSVPIPQPSSHFPLHQPDLTPVDSVLHYANIAKFERTMVFLPCDETILKWFEYYEKHDIRTFTYFTFDSDTKVANAFEECKKIRSFVFLTWSRLQTGVTFPITTVIDCGYTQQLSVDYGERSVRLETVPTSSEERVQRAGRVNRYMAGTAYYNDIKVRSSVVMDGSGHKADDIYLWLWSKLFGLEVREVNIAQYQDAVPDLSMDGYAMLCCARTHPLLVLPYLADDGAVYPEVTLTSQFFVSTLVRVSNDDNFSVEMWRECNTGPRPWLDAPYNFRTSVFYPEQWAAIPAVVWMSMKSGRDLYQVEADNRSVATFISSGRGRSSKKGKSTTSLGSALKRPTSVMTAVRTPAFVMEEFPKDIPIQPRVPMRTIQEVSSTEAVRPALSAIGSDETENLIRVGTWVDAVSEHKSVRRKSKSSSSGSVRREEIRLLQVDPIQHKMFTLYPLDPELYAIYSSDNVASETDFRRYEGMRNAKRGYVFVALSTDHETNVERQREYFLSTIRVHNYFAALHLQKKVTAGESSWLDKFIGRSSELSMDNISATAKLLYAMGHSRYYVAIDKRSQHVASSSATEYTGSLKQLRIVADYFLHTTSDVIANAISRILQKSVAVSDGDGIIATAWHFGEVLIMPLHVFSKAENSELRLKYTDEFRDIAVCHADFDNQYACVVRTPCENEQVLFLGFDTVSGERQVFGTSNVTKHENVWLHTKTLESGYSGCLVVATRDAAVLGVYLGFFGQVDELRYGYFSALSELTFKI